MLQCKTCENTRVIGARQFKKNRFLSRPVLRDSLSWLSRACSCVSPLQRTGLTWLVRTRLPSGNAKRSTRAPWGNKITFAAVVRIAFPRGERFSRELVCFTFLSFFPFFFPMRNTNVFCFSRNHHMVYMQDSKANACHGSQQTRFIQQLRTQAATDLPFQGDTDKSNQVGTSLGGYSLI